MAAYPNLLLVVLQFTLSIICFCGISLTEAHNSGFSVELIHRDSPKSPFYSSTETPFQRVINAFNRSVNRVNHFYPKAKVSPNSPQSEIKSIHGEYLMKYSIGTPPFEIMGIADTGSDITWTQCNPCDNCYSQTDPLFDPSKSTTYQNVPCSSDVCINSSSRTSCSSSNCEYSITYGDGSHSNGDLAFETLTLGSTKGTPISFPKISIGCGHDNAGIFLPKVSGIVGLGAGAVSLTSQIAPSIDNKFSYCLVPYFQTKTRSKINFGENAVVSGPGTVSTPISSGPVDTFYYLTLKGMSVGGKMLEFVGGSASTVAGGNIIIDSGTTVTVLPEEFYTKLESAVAAQINLKRVPGPSPIVKLCYNSPPNSIQAPIVTAHFTGADVVLYPLNTFVSVSNDLVCFAFTSSSSGAIYGNVAQLNYQVGYDKLKKTVSFRHADCVNY